MEKYKILELGRGPTLEGTRFTVYDIVPYLLEGHNSQYIAAIWGLPVEAVETFIHYFEEHKEEVLAANARIEERIARGNPPEVQALIDAGRGKARALREELLRKRQREGNGARHSE